MARSSEFTDFFEGDWQTLLEAHRVLPEQAFGYPIAEPVPVSWDRSAAWIVFNLMKGADMARGRKPAVNESAAKLIEALAFVKVATKPAAPGFESKVMLSDGWLFAHDGVIAAGISLGGNDVAGYVSFNQLSAALSNVGKELVISSSPEGIEFKSGDYEVMVPNCDTEDYRPAPPDAAPAYPLAEGARLKEALAIAGRVVKDTAEHVRDAAIYNLGQQFLATDGLSVVEAFHANNMPPGLVIPKAFSNALNKIDKAAVNFTFDQQNYRSLTVFFDDGSYLRTQLYPPADYPADVIQKYPAFFADFERVINTPKGFFEAAAAIAPFGGEHGEIAITGGAVCTDYREGLGWFSHKEVKGLPEGVWVREPLISRFNDAEKVYFGDANANPPIMVFAGGNWRAAVAAIQRPIPAGNVIVQQPTVTATAPDPATAPAWGTPAAQPAQPPEQPPAAPATAPAAQQAQQPAQQAQQPAQQAQQLAVVLPFTPRSRQTVMPGAPGWDTTPYTLQPGETPEQFCVEGEAPAQWVMAPANPTPPVAAAAQATPTFAAPATTPENGAPTFATGPTAPTPASPSEIPGGFTPFQPGQAGAPTFASPVPSTAPVEQQTANVTAFPSSPATPPWAVPSNDS